MRRVGPVAGLVLMFASVFLAAPAPFQKGIRMRPGDDVSGAFAEARLKAGRPMMAAEMARRCLKAQPDSLACLSVLVRAQASMGRCEGLDADFLTLRRTPEWSAKLAMSEGLCAMRHGDMALADECFAEAAFIKPKLSVAVFQQGMVDAREGDVGSISAVLTDLWELGDTDWMQWVLEGWIAFVDADRDVDAHLHFGQAESERSGRVSMIQRALMSCYRWTDLGDPFYAAVEARLGVSVTMNQPRLVACRGEALRRVGDVIEARYLLSRPWNEGVQAPVRDAVISRVWVDLGDLAEARAALAKVPNQLDPEYVASAWYLARAEGDTETMQRMADRYATLAVPPGRTLDAMVPWEASR